MKKLNKKGFTLIELMAVIIVLIVIIFIAINKVTKSTKETKDKTIQANAITYFKAVEDLIDEDSLTSSRLKNGFFSLEDMQEYGINISGTKPKSAVIYISNYNVVYGCLIYGKKRVTYDGSNYTIAKTNKCADFDITLTYTGEPYTYQVPVTGKYKIELWGAKGGTGAVSNTTYYGGNGAYTSGIADLQAGQELYIYVGGAGPNHVYNSNALCDGGWNGGGAGGQDSGNDDSGGGGGGATDVALVYSDVTYDETTKMYTRTQESYASRIMVAAGGGGGSWSTVTPGTGAHGGKLSVVDLICYHGGSQKYITKGSQTDGYAFGYAASGTFKTNGDGKAGGGAGYWSGINPSWGGQGAGGTSYISGHTGCVAVKAQNDITKKDGCNDGTTDNSCSIHYSGIKFTDTVMLSGSESMPNPNGTGEITGNNDDGYARISLIR